MTPKALEGRVAAVSGKSEASTERRPGSIYSVVEEIRALGGEALPVRMDIRREEDVEGMVDKTIQAFGRLDILVNNASALWWEAVLKTALKRYDLMWEVNVRGTYLCCYHALPHLIENGWGHVVTMSPPISADPNPGRVAYATTTLTSAMQRRMRRACRAAERTRTTFLLITGDNSCVAGICQACKCRIYKPLYFLSLAQSCTVLRSQWCQYHPRITFAHGTKICWYDRG
jgi:NADP-dependent 3-hydroxy acid dehydrogenase YdfG